MTVKHTTAALLTLSLAATAAGAQARPAAQAGKSNAPACNIQSGGSAQILSAYESLNAFASGEPTAASAKELAKAVSLVTAKSDKANTDVARQWVLAQTLAAYTLIPNQATLGTRAQFGFAGDPQAQVDILIVADSALDAVAAAHPTCQSQIVPLQRMVLISAVNEATGKFNAGDVAGAKTLAQRVLTMQPESPHAMHLLANVAVKEQQYPTAVELFEKVAVETKDDSAMAELYSTSVQSAAYLLNSLADAATGEEQAALAKRSADYFRQYLAVKPDDAAAQAALGRAMVATGDTAAASALYGAMLQDPSKYDGIELINAAVSAANGGRAAEAVRLVEAGLQSNPNLRDGLFVLANVAVQAEQFDKVVPAATKLIQLDPNNPDNYNLLARGYEGLLTGTTDKKLQKTYTDSMMRVTAEATKMPAKVTVADFSQGEGNQRVLNGTVENLTDAPADYVLRVEFLDASGNVVATKEEALAAVAPKSSKNFSITVDQPGAVAYRYARIGG
jgi:cytochrome c-type biogenesis protein CcmH/NrfG